MITTVLGGLGAGKTLFAVEQMVRFARAGIRVVTNIETAIPGVEMFPEPIVRYDHKGTVVGGFWENESAYYSTCLIIDEADYYFDAMDWSKFGPSFQRWLKSVRKSDQEVILITQVFENLHVRIRRLAQRTVFCENTARTNWLIRDGWLPKFLGRYYRIEFVGPVPRKDAIAQQRYISRADARRYYALYDTRQRVG